MIPFHLEEQYLRQIFENIQDGIIIMNEEREILLMNPSAKKLTGWKLHEQVPYCSFCEQREVENGENQCYLIAHDEIPYFLSEMPMYHGERINVEMSTALMFHDEATGKKEYLLVLRNQELRQKEEEARLSKQMIQMLIDAKESEHKRLAQELHDGVGQSLYTISVALQAVESFIHDERVQNYVEEVRDELDQVMNDVKAYSYQLRPQSLDRLGLIATIRGMITTLEKSHPHLSIDFSTNMTEELPASVKINLYRVIQEAMHNMIKYADAQTVNIRLMADDEKLRLQIEDDGIGFNTMQPMNLGLGLKHMRERIDLIGGSFTIKSARGKGTVILASIPKGEGFL